MEVQGTKLQILSFNMSPESIHMTLDIKIPLSSGSTVESKDTPEDTQKDKLLRMLEDSILKYKSELNQLRAEIGVKARDLNAIPQKGIPAYEEHKISIQKSILSLEQLCNVTTATIKTLEEYVTRVSSSKTINLEQELVKIQTEHVQLQECSEEDLAQVESNTLLYADVETQETETRQGKLYASAAYMDILQELM